MTWNNRQDQKSHVLFTISHHRYLFKDSDLLLYSNKVKLRVCVHRCVSGVTGVVGGGRILMPLMTSLTCLNVQSLAHNGRLNIDSFSSHRSVPWLPDWVPLDLFIPILLLLCWFSLISSSQDWQRNRESIKIKHIKQVIFVFLFSLLFITQEHTSFTHAVQFLHQAVHGVCRLFYFYHNSKQYTKAFSFYTDK